MTYSPLFLDIQYNRLMAAFLANPPCSHSRAQPLPQVEPTESSASSLIDVDSPHVSSVTSDYKEKPVKTTTQAERLEHEVEDASREMAQDASDDLNKASRETKRKYDEVSHDAKNKYDEVSHDAKNKYDELSHEAKHKYEEGSAEAKEKYKEAKKVASQKAQQAKSKAKAAEEEVRENSDNPVVVGNAVVIVALSAALGFGAYRKYAAGELTWKVAGTWAGIVGLFAAGDYYFSQYVLLGTVLHVGTELTAA